MPTENTTETTTNIAAEIWQENFEPIFADIDRQIAEADAAAQNIIDNGVREYVKNL